MPIKPIHDDIRNALKRHLSQANFLIYISVAWVTDEELLNILIEKSKVGVTIELIIHDDRTEDEKINFSDSNLQTLDRLINAGGKIFLLHNNHNKYCIIDLNTYITGSYNWTYAANIKGYGKENIDIHFDEHKLAYFKACEFKKLKELAEQYSPDIKTHSLAKHLIFDEAIEQFNTFYLLSLPTGGQALTTKEVFEFPGNFTKSIDGYKAASHLTFCELPKYIWILDEYTSSQGAQKSSSYVIKSSDYDNPADDLPF